MANKKKKPTPKKIDYREVSRGQIMQANNEQSTVATVVIGSLQRIADSLEAINARHDSLDSLTMKAIDSFLKTAPIPEALKKELRAILKEK